MEGHKTQYGSLDEIWFFFNVKSLILKDCGDYNHFLYLKLGVQVYTFVQ